MLSSVDKHRYTMVEHSNFLYQPSSYTPLAIYSNALLGATLLPLFFLYSFLILSPSLFLFYTLASLIFFFFFSAFSHTILLLQSTNIYLVFLITALLFTHSTYTYLYYILPILLASLCLFLSSFFLLTLLVFYLS